MASFQSRRRLSVAWCAHRQYKKTCWVKFRLSSESNHLHYEKPQSRSTSEIRQVCPREGCQMWHNTEVPRRPELSCLSVIHVISAVGCSHGSVATDFSCDSRLSSVERCQFCRLLQHQHRVFWHYSHFCQSEPGDNTGGADASEGPAEHDVVGFQTHGMDVTFIGGVNGAHT